MKKNLVNLLMKLVHLNNRIKAVMKKFFEYFQDVSFIAIIIGNIIVLPVACAIPNVALKTKLAKVTKETDVKISAVEKELHRSEDYLFELIKQYAIDKPKEEKEVSTKIENDDTQQSIDNIKVSHEANLRRVKELKLMRDLIQKELELFKTFGYE